MSKGKEMPMLRKKTRSFVSKALFAASCSLLPCSSVFATQFFYIFNMNGPSESPANGSPGFAAGTAAYDNVAHTLALTCNFQGLQGNVTQTHFHATTTISGLPDNNPVGETPEQAANAAGTVGIAVGNTTLPGFPLNVKGGTYVNTLNLADPAIYNTAFLAANGGTAAGAEPVFAAALASGKTYWNIHSSTVGGGEIRGFPIPVPEPTTLGLVAAGLALCARRRAR